jgi:hypothetical protein
MVREGLKKFILSVKYILMHNLNLSQVLFLKDDAFTGIATALSRLHLLPPLLLLLVVLFPLVLRYQQGAAAQQVKTYYLPNPSTVTANSKVTWNNKDIAPHTATATD